MADFDLNIGPNLPPKTNYGIGAIGAGFIMRDIHLPAYREAGFDVVARSRPERRRTPGPRQSRTASAPSTTPGGSCSTTSASRSWTSLSRRTSSSRSCERP
jgi:hypothetical protein